MSASNLLGAPYYIYSFAIISQTVLFIILSTINFQWMEAIA